MFLDLLKRMPVLVLGVEVVDSHSERIRRGIIGACESFEEEVLTFWCAKSRALQVGSCLGLGSERVDLRIASECAIQCFRKMQVWAPNAKQDGIMVM